MTVRKKIIANEALFYTPDRLSPGIGAIRLFPEQNQVLKALAWVRWWHWTGLVVALLLALDARI